MRGLDVFSPVWTGTIFVCREMALRRIRDQHNAISR